MDITGKLVKLRGYRLEDAEKMPAIFADPAHSRYLGDWALNAYVPEHAGEFIESSWKNPLAWAIECLEDGQFIGGTGFHELNQRHRHCWWGINVGPPSRWNKGYGTEACQLAMRHVFWHHGMEKVYLYVWEENVGAQRAYEKSGFQVEGRLPRHIWRQGHWETLLLMAVYRDHPLYAPPEP
jgi:RimJ/RimL family protein N-acetyltransferase